MQTKKICVEEQYQGKRLDAYLAKILQETFSRSQIKKVIELGGVRVGSNLVSAHYAVKEGDVIEIEWLDRVEEDTIAEDIPVTVIHEDEDVILVNKRAGMVVHPAAGNQQHTLVNALLFHVQNLSTVGGKVRPGIVHRLDKDTSGIMIVAKSDAAHRFLADQFKDQTIERRYHVLVRGVVQHNEGICEEPVGRAFKSRKKMIVRPAGGKSATTFFRVLERFKEASLLELKLQTGRTHQIRVHMAFMDHPVLGDPLYGVKSTFITRQAVHAYALGFVHPKTKKKMTFECPLPEDMQHCLDALRRS